MGGHPVALGRRFVPLPNFDVALLQPKRRWRAERFKSASPAEFPSQRSFPLPAPNCLPRSFPGVHICPECFGFDQSADTMLPATAGWQSGQLEAREIEGHDSGG